MFLGRGFPLYTPSSTDPHRSHHFYRSKQYSLIPAVFLTMCIQYCCKNCGSDCTKLTHRWARERCNDYFSARSENQNITDCPNGPWELQRASHRHPYRGAQVCESCKKAGRKDYKVIQSTRQKANVALGERAEYAGAINLGELEIPDTFYNPHFVEGGKADAMRLIRESFKSANGHLLVHELERAWASRLTVFDIGINAGAWTLPSKLASTFGQRTSEEALNRGNTAIADKVSRSPHRQIHPSSKAATYRPNQTSRSACQNIQYNTSSDTNKRNITNVEREASRSAQQHVQCQNNSDTNKQNITPVKGKERSRDPDREAHYNSASTTRSSSSQSACARPWDL